MKEGVSVLIPTYNERENVSLLLPKLLELPFVEEIIVIDDGSVDGTREFIKELKKNNPKIKLIERSAKLGIGTAYKEGIKKASCDFIVTMDADLSHDPSDLYKFISKIKNADLVIGSRHLEGSQIVGWNLYRTITHLVANLLVKIILGINLSDATSGYRIYRTEIIKKIEKNIKSKGFSFQIETLFYIYKLKYKIVEVPIKFINRKKGISKFNLLEILAFILILLRLLPLRFKLFPPS